MKRLLILIALIITALMLICSCGVDTSTDETGGTETESSTGSTDSGTTDSDSGTVSTDSDSGSSDTTDSDTGAGDSGTTSGGAGDSDNLVEDPNVDDWWTDNKQ